MQTTQGDRRDRLVGRLLEGRYRILERLARGGMSTVYSGVDERLDRPVAVKVMSAALSNDPAFADRFAREARVAARLAHLNAVSVYDQGVDGEHVFLIMELVRGRTLRDLLRERGALSPAQAVSIMEPVLAALAAAHRAGLVHRDVKPENILLSDDGVVKVADFGLARAVEADLTSTRTGLMMGTVAYCPPEQISRGAADTRSDVYSAGVVFFELLTGRAPYVGDNAMAVAYQHVNSDMPAPSSRRTGIPRQLDELVLRATSREPSGRPLDAGALLAELHDARVDLGLPVVAVPPRRPGPAADLDATQRIDRIADGHPSMPPYPPGSYPPGTDFAGPVAADATTAPTPDRPYRGQRTQYTAIQQPDDRPATPSRQQRRPVSKRQQARRRAAAWLILVLLLGLLTGWGAWYLTVGRYHQVPNVAGQSQSAAISLLRNDGFTVSSAIQQDYSETVPVGRVLRSDPAAGSHLLGGKPVRLVLSRGAERFTVPRVAGQPFETAQRAFADLPVRLDRRDVADGTGKVTAGSVIRTDPAADSKVRRNQTIVVYVSTGPPIVSVPGVTGQSQGDATGNLRQAAFKVTSTETFSDQVPAGTVISQDPPSGSRVPKFSTVTLVVSKGPPLVTLPKIASGTSAHDARRKLEALGLTVRIKTVFGGLLGKVVGMDPGAGHQVPVGSQVTLTVV
ncbi:MAG: Stk1 family PASTA domain-containing Ser/Thr kinase [Jatrophihabitantaceae bacterium]